MSITSPESIVHMILGLLLGVVFQRADAHPAGTPCMSPNVEAQEYSEEYQIGVMVKAVQAALIKPERHASLDIILHYGTDSRYYTMIRGWLMQELKGTRSQLLAAREEGAREKLRARFEFLTRALRGIDLE